MTGLRPTRRRVLAVLGACGVGAGGVAAVPPRRISASLTTYRWVLSLNRRDPPAVPELADLDPVVRRAVRDAVEGGYESAEPPTAVRRLFDVRRKTYVRVEGTYYRLDPTLPVYEVWLEPVDESTATGAVTLGELEQCADPDPRGFRTPPLERADDPARTYSLDPRLRDCIERHRFVRLGDGDYYRYHVDVDDPGSPYAITATEVSAATVAGIDAPVADGDDALPETRAALRAAADETLRRQSIPDGVRALAADFDYVSLGDRFYELDLGHPGAAPVRIDVAVTDARAREFDPAWLDLSVTNVGGETVTLQTGPPTPFGVLHGEADGGGDLPLWSPTYEESRFVGTHAGRVTGIAAAGVSTALTPETLTTRYAVRRNPGRLDAGVYRVSDGFGVRSDGEATPYPYDVRIRVA
ncbi:hypothetical protein ACFQJD_07040 [Haloplanus sp. GCM10025708]|uniref:hypothetical protein n=1 Tax=Haloplanus sp. GCM10025708 TaxID=3252679 RepID=UPI003609DBBA